MGKHDLMIWAALVATAATAPAFAQDAPAAAKEKAPATTATSIRPSGAVSSSYARCAPGSPIGGIVVKGGSNPTRRTGDAQPEGSCPSTDPAEGKGRTYTGGRRNADAPVTAIEAGTTVPTTNKSISEKGVAASKPH